MTSVDDDRLSRRKVARTVVAMHGRGDRQMPTRVPTGLDAAALVRGAQTIVHQDRTAERRKARSRIARSSRRKNRK